MEGRVLEFTRTLPLTYLRELGSVSLRMTNDIWVVSSAVSSLGLWVLGRGNTVLGSSQWEDSESHGLSESIGNKLLELLAQAQLSPQQVDRWAVVSGPGAFTGLRVSTAFCQGLARSTAKPLFGIPSFELVGQPFFIPLRHQKAKHLSVQAAIESGFEFLKVVSNESFVLEQPIENSIVLGTSESPLWPSVHQIRQCVPRCWNRSLQLDYGSGPKIFGVRVPS